jgi:hypothetical protein
MRDAGRCGFDVLNGTRDPPSFENRTSPRSLDIEKSAPAPRLEVFRIRPTSLSFLREFQPRLKLSKWKLPEPLGQNTGGHVGLLRESTSARLRFKTIRKSRNEVSEKSLSCVNIRQFQSRLSDQLDRRNPGRGSGQK